MESAPPPPDLEASLLQRWFLVSPPGKSALKEHKCFSEIDLRDISDVLRRVGQGAWSRIPRIYVVLRLLDRLDVIDLFLAQAISDIYFPFTHQSLPQSLNPSVAHEFLQVQRVVLSSALDLERETGRHRHFPSADDVPFIKVEELGKGAYGYVDRVISTVSHREYARKLIPRGRTFQRDKKILRDFERELGTLKKLRHHRHIVQLVGSYTDPRFVGIIMSPVAEGDLKDFLNDCASDAKGNPHSRKSFTRSFFGCLTSALSYLHDNTIRHKDIKPQNVLVSQHTIYLTDFGISLDWSEIGHSTTTGPTPKTARYCAPEVSEYEPRNTSSDMWSLGCVFLEIWTVLKGETVANLHAFLEANLTLSSCYHLNTEATFQWMKNLESKPTLADNPPLDWIRHLLVEDKGKRWTARQLLSEIETVNSNPEAKFAFSGQCCIEGLESAESVISSNASFSESATNDYVPQPPPPVPSLSLSQNKEERPEAHSGASQLQRNSSPSDLNDSTSNSFDNNPEPDSTTIMSESIITPPASRITLASVPKDEDAVLLAVGESPERKSHAGRSENSAPDLDQTQLKTQVDDLGRAQSTHPEISLARPPMVESSSLSTRPVPVEHFSLSSDASKDGATDSGERTRSEMLDEKSIAGAHEHVEWTSSSSSPNVERTSPSTTSGKEDLQHQHNRSGDTVEEDIKLTAPEYYISRAEDPITMDANTQRIAFPAPYQSITFSPDNHATSIHQSEDHSQIIPKASSNEHKMDQSNATTLIEPASRSTDITSPADISRIAYNVQDISRLEGSVIPTYISSEPDATRHPTRLDQETIPPPPTKPNETGVNKQQTGPVDYMASQSQKTRGESSPSTTSSTDVLANEVASRDQASSDHVLEPQKVKTENHDISVDAEWPLVQPDTPRELGSSPSPSRPDAPVFGSSRNEDLQRLDQTKIPSTELVPYAHPEVPRANNETSLICGKCYERLTGKFVRAFSMRFHLECFTCPVSRR
ncbi:hypothetical protein DM02DRAFT_435918 [Periconia macrospinosa]|uniref:Protein kinase domain-containing protein n=1 Tax=Periconia macrospinosa TaxID=97972 RepID=A0A2V1DMR4_9PLEO|nr:hypothetical protein DM02DRAFT_435918 [Periconia macrospinosa]